MTARDATLSWKIATSTGVISAFAAPQSGINIWGVMLHHTAAANVRVSDGTTDFVQLSLAAAGSESIMFPLPIFLITDPDVEAITAGAECFIYYSLA